MYRYKDYKIETSQERDGQWRAMVTRQDGRKIRTHGGEYHFIETLPSISKDMTNILAKEIIDKGDLQ